MKAIRKMDEMEMGINLKAIRLAWVYGVVFLLMWFGYDWLRMGSFNSMVLILLSSQEIIYWTVQLYLKWKLGRGEK